MASKNPEGTATGRGKAKPSPPEHMRWKKGQSGNPGGMKPLPPEAKIRLTAMLPEALDAIEGVVRDPGHRQHFDAAKWVAERCGVRGQLTQGTPTLAELEEAARQLALLGDSRMLLAVLAAEDPAKWGSLVGKPQVAADTVDTVEFVPLVSAPSSSET